MRQDHARLKQMRIISASADGYPIVKHLQCHELDDGWCVVWCPSYVGDCCLVLQLW